VSASGSSSSRSSGCQRSAFTQWLRYPTADVPRKGDGSPNLTAPAPRLADGKPDFSGIWHVALRNPCNRPSTGSPPVPKSAGHRWRAISVRVSRAACPFNRGRRRSPGSEPRRQPRRSACAVPAGQSAASLGTATPQQTGAHTKAAGRAVRGERHVPADLHRRTAAAGGSDTRLDGVLDRTLGRRHARHQTTAFATTCGWTWAAPR
jgi:hypothetical protein